jgi:16S rRNA (guanine527-N7)-methyltransferase
MNGGKFVELERVAGPVSRETFERLLAFEKLFVKWAARINLTAPSTISEIWNRHILDSAQLVRLAPDALDWVDLGSGGGFPGAVIAILMADKPGGQVRLVESNNKKCAFLRAALSEIGLRPDVYPVRIETIIFGWRPPQVVTARALAPLSRLLALTEPWLSAGTRALFHKGEEYRGEIKLADDTWNLDLVEHPSMVDPCGVILDITGIERRRAR